MLYASARLTPALQRQILMGGVAAFSLALALGGGATVARAQGAEARARNYSPEAAHAKSVITQARRSYIQQQTTNGNNIIADGQTQTHLRVNGLVTDIFTRTFSGGNAYNSFSQFGVGAENTVNLFIPKQANQLVNIVRDGAVNVQGVLNSYQNGQLGGRVVFADSYGFVVGPRGVINVGSLSIVTPTKDIVAKMMSGGVADDALVARVAAGDVPISPDGSVVISGRINAQNAIYITAADVRVAGSYENAKQVAQKKAQFVASVNADGMEAAGALTVRNGKVVIRATELATIDGIVRVGDRTTKVATRNSVDVSAKKVAITGSIYAAGSEGQKGGEIKIFSAEDIDVASTSHVDASGVGGAFVADKSVARIISSNTAPVSLSAGRAVSVSADYIAKVQAYGDGSATGNTAIGIGVGVGLAIMGNTTSASLGDNVTIVTPGDVSVSASSSLNRGDA